MAGSKLLTKHDSRMCLKLAWRVAQDLGYSLTPIDDCSRQFTASKGNAVVGFLAGPLAPHCKFDIAVESYGDTNELTLQKNSPWLTGGAIGVNKVNRQAEELLSAITCAIEKDGGAIHERREF